ACLATGFAIISGADCFTAGAGLRGGSAFTTGFGIIHSLTVISSIAKSLPQPPSALFDTFNNSVPAFAGVVNLAVYCSQVAWSVGVMSPVANFASSVSSVFSIVKRRFGLILVHLYSGLHMFTSQTPSSYIVLG